MSDVSQQPESALCQRHDAHFTGDMPKRLEPAVRYGIIGQTNRTYYFEYRKGTRLIPPALQEKIRKLFRDNGWTEEVMFDDYEEGYDW